jgi:hypothetical protein
MRKDILDKLVQVARSQKLISYDDLNNELNLGLDYRVTADRDRIGHWLGEISEEETPDDTCFQLWLGASKAIVSQTQGKVFISYLRSWGFTTVVMTWAFGRKR